MTKTRRFKLSQARKCVAGLKAHEDRLIAVRCAARPV
jgi:hypothetical protein